MGNSAIALKISTNSNRLNNYIRKYLAYLNHFFITIRKVKIYVEAVLDGFIVFWDSHESFQQAWQPFPPTIRDQSKQLGKLENFLLRQVMKDEFQNEPFIITFQAESRTSQDLLYLVQEFYQDIDPSIQIISEPKTRIQVVFQQYNQIKQYSSYLVTFLKLKNKVELLSLE